MITLCLHLILGVGKWRLAMKNNNNIVRSAIAIDLLFTIVIIVLLFTIISQLDTIIDDRTSRVTEINHIAYIEHFYGNLPTGEIRNGDNKLPTYTRKK